MRKLSTLACLLLVGGLAAQQVARVPARGAIQKLHAKQGPALAGQAKGGGGCIYSEDFEGGSIPAGWDIGAQVEQYTDDPNGQPLGTYVGAWRVDNTTTANNGGYFDVPDVPPGNKFAYANDDGDPCNCAMTDIGLVTPSYDFTGLSGLGLTCRIWNDGQYANSSGKIQASTDGGATWTDLYTVGESADWQNVAVVLTAYDNQASVRIRFQWDDGGGWGTGMAVDDVCIAVLPPTDMAIEHAWLSEYPGSYDDATIRNQEYTLLPLEQAAPISVATAVINNGSEAQTNVTLTVNINGTDYVGAPVASLAPGERDTLTVETGYTPAAVGAVNVTYTVSSDGSEANPGDNTAMRSFQITGPSLAEGDNAMGVDANSLDGRVDLSSNTNYTQIANRFQIENTGSTAYAAGVVFYGGSTSAGSLVTFSLQDDNGEVAGATDFEVLPEYLSGAGDANFITVPFDAPADLDPTMDYILIADNENPDTVSIGTSGDVTPGGLLGFDNSSQQFTQYIGFGNPAMMMRLYLANITGISEQQANGLTLGLNAPNPADRSTRVPFSLVNNAAVSYQMTDMNGRIVARKDLGTLGAGQHTIDVDVANLASGAYSFTLTTNGARLSRYVVVAH